MEQSFGKVLKAIRKQRRMTQKMLCEDICSQSVLSRIESDTEIPNVVVMQQLCDRLGVSIEQVLHHNSRKIVRNYQLFAALADLFRHKRFVQLKEKLAASAVFDYLYLEREFQLYFYYLGSCEYYLDHNCEKALAFLKQGLQYTSNVSHLTATNEEVQLISCIGKVYTEMGRLSEGEYYLEKSMELYQEIPKEREQAESAKVFFNYACYLYKINALTDALMIADKGIALAQWKNSYYFLDELFLLKSMIYERADRTEKSLLYRQMAKKIKLIAEIE